MNQHNIKTMKKLLTLFVVVSILLLSSCARRGTCPTYADAEIKSENLS